MFIKYKHLQQSIDKQSITKMAKRYEEATGRSKTQMANI